MWWLPLANVCSTSLLSSWIRMRTTTGRKLEILFLRCEFRSLDSKRPGRYRLDRTLGLLMTRKTLDRCEDVFGTAKWPCSGPSEGADTGKRFPDTAGRALSFLVEQ